MRPEPFSAFIPCAPLPFCRLFDPLSQPSTHPTVASSVPLASPSESFRPRVRGRPCPPRGQTPTAATLCRCRERGSPSRRPRACVLTVPQRVPVPPPSALSWPLPVPLQLLRGRPRRTRGEFACPHRGCPCACDGL